MPKFRKKPVVIEAFQMTIERRYDNSEWPNWLNEAWQKDSSEAGAAFHCTTPGEDMDKLIIHTLEGNHTVGWDDYIIQGVKGELYPCKPDIFLATYEPVSYTDKDEIHIEDFGGMSDEACKAAQATN